MIPTIKDIAKAADVSIATVSRVINDLGGYSVETQKKVEDAVSKLGYSKNENATSLVTKKSHTIGILIPNVNTGFYGDIVTGIEEIAYKFNYSVILTHAGVEGNRLINSLELMKARRVDGLIIVSINLSQEQITVINKMMLPTILLSTKSEDESLPFIKVNDYSAVYAATEYLIKQGHSKIGLVGINKQDPIAGLPRIKGYLDCLCQNNIKVNKELIVPGDYTFESGQNAMAYYFKKNNLPSAIVCASDETALGVISIAHSKNINVPKDLSVMGYDDTNLAWMVTPSLTTIKQPFYDMGAQGCQAIINFLKTGEKITSHELAFKLVERATVIKYEEK